MEKTKVSKRRAPAATKAVAISPTAKAAPEVSASTVDVGDPREWDNRRASAQATRAANARQASGRRRFVDPTTCEREYSKAEMEFMHAMHDYKQSSGRMFPTWSEVLEVIKALGYEKVLDVPKSSSTATMNAAASH